MFNKKNNQYNQMPYGQFEERFVNPNNQYYQEANMSQMYPNIQYERFQHEIMENRRRINNLAKRIQHIENYLRIRDTTDYEQIDEENLKFYNR